METLWLIIPIVILGLLVWCIFSLGLAVRWLFLPKPLEFIRRNENVPVLIRASFCLPAILGTVIWALGFSIAEYIIHFSAPLLMGLLVFFAYVYYKLALLKNENYCR